MVFSDKQSQRLRFMRFVAVGLIVITHISQELKLGLEHWTNTGVQMFLVISGFIMGQATTVDWKKWIKRRALRILPSFYIILLITALAYWIILHKNIIGPQYLAHFTTLHFLFFPSYPFWGGHLWYITAIVLCYAIFPVLLASKKLKNISFLFLYVIVVPPLLLVLFYKTGMPYRLSGDIYCFIMGFAAAKIYKQNPPGYFNILLIFLLIMVVAGEYIIIQNDYWNMSLLETSVHLLRPWKKFLMGLTVCLLLYLPLFDKISNNAVVNFIDKYSYEIYLSHKMFILGSLSILYLTGNIFSNILIAIFLSLLCSLIVYKLAIFIRMLLEKQVVFSPKSFFRRAAKSRGR